MKADARWRKCRHPIAGAVVWLFLNFLSPCDAQPSFIEKSIPPGLQAGGEAGMPPVLQNPGPTPKRVETDTSCPFQIVYRDAQGRAPDYIRVVVDGKWYEMVYAITSTDDPRKGVTATKTIAFRQPGQHTYYYEARAGGQKARYPLSGRLAVVATKKYVPPPPPPRPPVLHNPILPPTRGLTGEGYTFGITYSDPDNDAPDYLRVAIDNKARPLDWPVSPQTNYRNGIQATIKIKFEVPGDYKFHFETQSAKMKVRYPSDEELTITIESKAQRWILFGIGLACLLILTAMDFYIFFNIFRAPAPRAARFAILVSLILAFLLFAYLFVHILSWMYIAGGALLVVGAIFLLFTRQ